MLVRTGLYCKSYDTIFWKYNFLLPPLESAITAARVRQQATGIGISKVIVLSPQSNPLMHQRVMTFVQNVGKEGLIILCGRYEGIDERLIERCVDEEISIGDFVLSGGEIPAMALLDAIIRQLPGVLNDTASAQEDSFVAGLLDCPHYTRPEEYNGQRVPDVLLSGHHEQIRRWRLMQALGRTWQRRPDLMMGRRFGGVVLLRLGRCDPRPGSPGPGPLHVVVAAGPGLRQ